MSKMKRVGRSCSLLALRCLPSDCDRLPFAGPRLVLDQPQLDFLVVPFAIELEQAGEDIPARAFADRVADAALGLVEPVSQVKIAQAVRAGYDAVENDVEISQILDKGISFSRIVEIIVGLVKSLAVPIDNFTSAIIEGLAQFPQDTIVFEKRKGLETKVMRWTGITCEQAMLTKPFDVHGRLKQGQATRALQTTNC